MTSEQSPSYYPVFLKVGGRKCVVVGGGEVALRKVRAFLECGASVEVISPQLCPGLEQLSDNGKIDVLPRRYQPGDLRGALVVIAATDDGAVNREVVKEARRGGVLANVVDDAEGSDFIVPSRLQRGNITIAVSTAGSSPALARKIRTRLEKDFGDEYAALVSLIEEVRQGLIRQGVRVDSDGWQEAIDLDLMTGLLASGEKEKVRQLLVDNLKASQKQGRGG